MKKIHNLTDLVLSLLTDADEKAQVQGIIDSLTNKIEDFEVLAIHYATEYAQMHARIAPPLTNSEIDALIDEFTLDIYSQTKEILLLLGGYENDEGRTPTA